MLCFNFFFQKYRLYFAFVKNMTQRCVCRLLRALRPEAIKVSTHFKVEGNLSKQYKLFKPNATFEELVWASDFHIFTEETSIPEDEKEWLLNNYKNRFNTKK